MDQNLIKFQENASKLREYAFSEKSKMNKLIDLKKNFRVITGEEGIINKTYKFPFEFGKSNLFIDFSLKRLMDNFEAYTDISPLQIFIPLKNVNKKK